MKKVITVLLCCSFVVCASSRMVHAGEIDLLLQKLVEKKILTPGEAQEIATETKEEMRKEIAQAKSDLLPQWLQTMKLKGDLRVRYQHERKKGSNNVGGRNSIDRDRGRLRLRVGAEAKVFDQAKVYFGIATGSDADPRSTNQTFSDSFAKKPLWIDYAYVDYKPFNWLTAQAGRMKNPLWEPGDMLWDTDINPEGAAFKLSRKVGSSLDVFLNTAAFVIDEEGNSSDPWMYVMQPGLNYALNENTKITVASAYYNFNQLQGKIADWSEGSNNRIAGAYEFGFDAISPSLQISFTDPLKQLGLELPFGFSIPFVSLFGEYVRNLEAPYAHTGYLAGLKFGDAKISNKGQWQAGYRYVMLGTQAWPDFLPDSDRYSGGRTGIRSHEVTFSYGLGKNWTVDLDYYNSELTAENSTAVDPDALLKRQHIIQADLNWKF